MDKKKLLLLLGAAIVATGTALAARSAFSGSATPNAQAAAAVPKGPKVLVAQRALPVGTIITADAVSFQDWPKAMVQDAYFLDGEADMAKLLGTVVRNPITAGQPITQGALVAPGDRGFLAAALGPGMRAITIPVSSKSGVGGFIFPGDHVDLLLTQTISGAGGPPLKETETILRNLRILATDTATSSEVVNGKTVVKSNHTVTIEVTPRLAEKISVAQTLGSLSLSLRSIADNQSDLDRLVASGNLKIPAGASKDVENRLLSQALNQPIEGPTTFVTGGDVSRFQRKTVPVAVSAPAVAAAPMSGGARPRGIFAPAVPTVLITRGDVTTAEPVGR